MGFRGVIFAEIGRAWGHGFRGVDARYAVAPTSALERRRELEDERSRLLALAVGDLLPVDPCRRAHRAPTALARTTAVVSRGRAHGGEDLELVDAFDEQALAIAAMRETIRSAAVAAWRDELTAAGLAPSSVAQRVSAVRRLAATLGADPLVQQVRCTHIQHEKPRALSDAELDRLLRHPDRRTVIGIRDRAILELLARAGLRRAELAQLTLGDIQARRRQPDARRRAAVAPGRGEQTRLEVVVRASKRGRTRTVPLHAEAHDALARWSASRSTSAADA
jgi:integrase